MLSSEASTLQLTKIRAPRNAVSPESDTTCLPGNIVGYDPRQATGSSPENSRACQNGVQSSHRKTSNGKPSQGRERERERERQNGEGVACLCKWSRSFPLSTFEYSYVCERTHIHTCMHAYMHTCMHAYIHAYIHVCTIGRYS